MLEADLYPPIKAYFEQQGYNVRAEVKNCDIVAMKDDEMIVVELKIAANLKLLIQATERQSITPTVFVAIPEPRNRNRHFKGTVRVLKKLGLGLILVRDGPLGKSISIEVQAGYDNNAQPRSRINKRKKSQVTSEVRGRSADYNVAGSTRTPLVTAYKETAIYLACCLEKLGPLSPKTLKALGGGEKTSVILTKNHYGWFERVKRGVYQVTPEGKSGLREFPELRRRARKNIPKLK